jgi:hypothetical protein
LRDKGVGRARDGVRKREFKKKKKLGPKRSTWFLKEEYEKKHLFG